MILTILLTNLAMKVNFEKQMIPVKQCLWNFYEKGTSSKANNAIKYLTHKQFSYEQIWNEETISIKSSLKFLLKMNKYELLKQQSQ